MQQVLVVAGALFLMVHGLIHLMGTVAYLKLGRIENLPYKTTLLGGSWDIGDRGMRLFGALWVLPAVGFVLGGLALLAGWPWWQPLLTAVAVVSLTLTVLDWSSAWAGAVLNVVVLAVVLIGPTVRSAFKR